MLGYYFSHMKADVNIPGFSQALPCYYLHSTAIYIKKKKKSEATGSVPKSIQRDPNESFVKEILLEISKRMHDREHSTLQRHSANTKERPPGVNGDLQFDNLLGLEFRDASLEVLSVF